jgi:hypothetical protein
VSFIDDLLMYTRFAAKLPSHLARRDTVEEGRHLLARRLDEREVNFLRLAERSIYGHPASPYLPLLRRAGCELGDLRAKVGADGLEETLGALRRAGVYVRFEQWKGREPLGAEGDGGSRPAGPRAVDNPSLRRHLESRSNGSTGVPTRTPIDLDHRAARSPISLLIEEAQGVLHLPKARIGGRLPESLGFGGALQGGGPDHVPERWFAPVLDPPRRTELRFLIAHHYVVTMARLHGLRVPRPEPLRLDRVIEVARWARGAIETRGGCVVRSTPSMALRVALAAVEASIDLAGATFACSGEPLTAAKMAGIASSGARAHANYSMSGLGRVGSACLAPHGVNDQHVMTDHLAVVQGRRKVGDREVDALLFTTLLPSSPVVFLNVESDDYGVLEERSCGCPLEALGLATHVRDVRSFKKLTAEGITLVGSEMEHVLEAVLPARFGGSALDYQLVEEEDERGFTRVVLNVSPSVRLGDESAVIDAVLGALRRASISADLGARLWSHAGAIRIRRVDPVLVGRGKLLPLRSERTHSPQAAREATV